jgi:hypothetical protein
MLRDKASSSRHVEGAVLRNKTAAVVMTVVVRAAGATMPTSVAA